MAALCMLDASLSQGGASVASAQTDAHETSLKKNTSAVSLEAITYADDNLGKTRHKCV